MLARIDFPEGLGSDFIFRRALFSRVWTFDFDVPFRLAISRTGTPVNRWPSACICLGVSFFLYGPRFPLFFFLGLLDSESRYRRMSSNVSLRSFRAGTLCSRKSLPSISDQRGRR